MQTVNCGKLRYKNAKNSQYKKITIKINFVTSTFFTRLHILLIKLSQLIKCVDIFYENILNLCEKQKKIFFLVLMEIN